MNLGFCAWLFSQRNRLPIDVMFHEVAVKVERGQPLRHRLLAAVNYLMALLVARTARRIFVAIPAWRPIVKRLLRENTPVTWLPVPSNIPVAPDSRDCRTVRYRSGSDEHPVIGHFGTYGSWGQNVLSEVLPQIMDMRPEATLMLLGRKGEFFQDRLVRLRPDLRARIFAPGTLDQVELSGCLKFCDVMVQPYPDGITGRHTSSMASLQHGRPVVTTIGRLTEDVWYKRGAVALAPAAQIALLSDRACALLADQRERDRLGEAGKKLYQDMFDIGHTIAGLRSHL